MLQFVSQRKITLIIILSNFLHFEYFEKEYLKNTKSSIKSNRIISLKISKIHEKFQ